jgi:site-specific recombinase XerD
MNNTIDRYKAKQLLEATIVRIDGAYAASTMRAYRSNFIKFIDYCEFVGADALPAAPETIATFVEQLTEDKYHSSTIRQVVASIASIHTLNNYANPTMHSEVKIAIRRMHRKIGRFCQQAYGITKDLLEEMLEVTDHSLRGLRDRALLLVAYDTMCRRSELVRLMVDDVDVQVVDRRNNIESMVIFIEQSKTDQEANGRWLRVSKQTAIALKDWIRHSGIKDGRLFRGVDRGNTITADLTSGQICKIYKRLARTAEFGEEFVKHVSGHSMRVGAAQDLLLSGASLPMMMAKGRWSKPDTVMRYVEKVGVPL